MLRRLLACRRRTGSARHEREDGASQAGRAQTNYEGTYVGTAGVRLASHACRAGDSVCALVVDSAAPREGHARAARRRPSRTIPPPHSTHVGGVARWSTRCLSRRPLPDAVYPAAAVRTGVGVAIGGHGGVLERSDDSDRWSRDPGLMIRGALAVDACRSCGRFCDSAGLAGPVGGGRRGRGWLKADGPRATFWTVINCLVTTAW